MERPDINNFESDLLDEVWDAIGESSESKSVLGMSLLYDGELVTPGDTYIKSDQPLSCVMLMLPESLRSKVQELQANIDTDDLDAKGLEQEPHVTARYGLHTQSSKDIQSITASTQPIQVSIGTSTIFAKDDMEFDVVKLNVASDSLTEFHDRLGELPHTDTHATYSAHITLAYVRKGSGKKYVGKLSSLNGDTVTFDSVVFSDGGKQKTVVTLGD